MPTNGIEYVQDTQVKELVRSIMPLAHFAWSHFAFVLPPMSEESQQVWPSHGAPCATASVSALEAQFMILVRMPSSGDLQPSETH